MFPANPTNIHELWGYQVGVLHVNVKLFKVNLIKTHLTSQSPSFFLDAAKTSRRIHLKWCSSITQTVPVAIPLDKKKLK